MFFRQKWHLLDFHLIIFKGYYLLGDTKLSLHKTIKHLPFVALSLQALVELPLVTKLLHSSNFEGSMTTHIFISI